MSKRRYKQDPQQKTRPVYNVEMISDFLKHLLWEVRIREFEHTAAPGTLNGELAEQIAPFMSKYQVHGLLPYSVLGTKGCTPAVGNDAGRQLREMLRAEAAEWVCHLEALAPLIEIAAQCAAAGCQPMGQVYEADPISGHPVTDGNIRPMAWPKDSDFRRGHFHE